MELDGHSADPARPQRSITLSTASILANLTHQPLPLRLLHLVVNRLHRLRRPSSALRQSSQRCDLEMLLRLSVDRPSRHLLKLPTMTRISLISSCSSRLLLLPPRLRLISTPSSISSTQIHGLSIRSPHSWAQTCRGAREVLHRPRYIANQAILTRDLSMPRVTSTFHLTRLTISVGSRLLPHRSMMVDHPTMLGMARLAGLARRSSSRMECTTMAGRTTMGGLLWLLAMMRGTLSLLASCKEASAHLLKGEVAARVLGMLLEVSRAVLEVVEGQGRLLVDL